MLFLYIHILNYWLVFACEFRKYSHRDMATKHTHISLVFWTDRERERVGEWMSWSRIIKISKYYKKLCKKSQQQNFSFQKNFVIFTMLLHFIWCDFFRFSIPSLFGEHFGDSWPSKISFTYAEKKISCWVRAENRRKSKREKMRRQTTMTTNAQQYLHIWWKIKW